MNLESRPGARHAARFGVLAAALMLVACGGAPRRAVHVEPAASVRPRSGPPRPGLLHRLAEATGLSTLLAQARDGVVTLFTISGIRLELRLSLHDPLTALAGCADLVTECYRLSSAATLDGCVASAPVCATAEPWHEEPCCPSACTAAYQSERARGAAANQALQATFFDAPTCFPGVAAMVSR